MSTLTRKQSLEIQAGADALLTPGGGGVAVWVRRDELEPRCAVRFRTQVKGGESLDAAKIATIVATLRVGVERITHAMADEMNMPREELESMVEKALEVLGPHYATALNIVR